MPFCFGVASILSGRLLAMDELAGAVAFSSAAVRTLLPARRRGEHFQKGRQRTLEGIVQFLHGSMNTSESCSCKVFLAFLFRLKVFVTWLKARKYFET